jgi:hypothetical protein
MDKELSSFIKLLRTVCADNGSLLSELDDVYEEELSAELRLIPTQYSELILSKISTFKQIAECVDFNKMSTIFPNNVSVNSYEKALGLIELFSTKSNINKFKNLCFKLKPLFRCVDYIISDPSKLNLLGQQDMREYEITI